MPSIASSILPAAAAVVALLASCSGSGDSGAATTVTTVPAAGVAGGDATCAAFAQINGTFRLLAVSAAFGGSDPTALAAAELTSAPAVTAAADSLFAGWPAELETERSAAQDDLVAPLERRAERGVQQLRDAGATDADLAVLRDVWAGVLASQRADAPPITLPALPTALDATLAAASAAFAAAVTPYDDDPSLLRTDADTPLTNAWLAQRCPDVLADAAGAAV